MGGTGVRMWQLASEAFAAMVPFWAVWPFETLVVSRRHVGGLPSLADDERDALADILKQLTTRYDNLFEAPFPYSMGFHQQPVHGRADGVAHLHASQRLNHKTRHRADVRAAVAADFRFVANAADGNSVERAADRVGNRFAE